MCWSTTALFPRRLGTEGRLLRPPCLGRAEYRTAAGTWDQQLPARFSASALHPGCADDVGDSKQADTTSRRACMANKHEDHKVPEMPAVDEARLKGELPQQTSGTGGGPKGGRGIASGHNPGGMA